MTRNRYLKLAREAAPRELVLKPKKPGGRSDPVDIGAGIISGLAIVLKSRL